MKPKTMVGVWVSRAVKILLMATVVCAICGFVVMGLWNWLTPRLFGWHAITFWQALGLFVLSKILFGGLRGGRGHGRHWRRGMRERWEKMTPEQREQLREHLHGFCSDFRAPAEPKTE